MNTEATIIRAADQASFWLLNDHMTPMLGSDLTDGRLGVIVSKIQPGFGPPPHVHTNEDEMFYVLAGEITFYCHGKLIRATAGSLVFAPRDVPHCFKCTSATPAKMVLVVTSTHFMDFADAMAIPAIDPDRPPEITPDLFDKLMNVTAQFGITMMPDHALPTAAEPAPAATQKRWVMGEHVSYLATRDQTAGHFTAVELRTAPGGGPPPHAHVGEDELVYVVDGRHEVLLGDRTEIAGPGDLVWVPRGTRHRYSNAGDRHGKLLSVHTPGGFEAFFDEVGIDADAYPVEPKLAPPTPEALTALLTRHGMTI